MRRLFLLSIIICFVLFCGANATSLERKRWVDRANVLKEDYSFSKGKSVEDLAEYFPGYCPEYYKDVFYDYSPEDFIKVTRYCYYLINGSELFDDFGGISKTDVYDFLENPESHEFLFFLKDYRYVEIDDILGRDFSFESARLDYLIITDEIMNNNIIGGDFGFS